MRHKPRLRRRKTISYDSERLPRAPDEEMLDQFCSAPTADRFAIDRLAVTAPNAFETGAGGHSHFPQIVALLSVVL